MGALPTQADVIVPSGGSGSICTDYTYAATSPNRSRQTCARADDNEVYFTVHFGKASSSNRMVDSTVLSYYPSGTSRNCPQYPYGTWNDLVIPAGSVRHTATGLCVAPRSVGSSAATATVVDDQYNHVGFNTTDAVSRIDSG